MHSVLVMKAAIRPRSAAAHIPTCWGGQPEASFEDTVVFLQQEQMHSFAHVLR